MAAVCTATQPNPSFFSAHAVTHKTTSPPSVEPRTVDELIRVRAQQEGNDNEIIAYPEEGSNYIGYSSVALDRLVDNAAAHYCKWIPQRLHSDDPVQVVGFLGRSDLDYLVAFLALSRLGHTALLLSTRITAEAHESLMSKTSATILIFGPEYSDVAKSLQQVLPHLQTTSIADVKSLPAQSLPKAKLDMSRETNNMSFIIHSSGSTGLPKPIFQTHGACLYSYSQSFGLVAHITLPLYHNHGISCLFRAIYARRKIYIYNARLPLTSQHLKATLRDHPDIRILYGVPYALKLLSETEDAMALLRRLDVVMFGGSACPRPTGDALVENGVNLVGHYGATEVGQLMTSFRDYRNDKGWDWLRVPAHLKPYLRMEERGPGLFELVVLKGWPSRVTSNRDDGSYATKDLFEPHPTIPDAWRYYARSDDTITLENGEKTNPLVMEGLLRQNKLVAEAVVFGIGKPRLGAFVIRSEGTSASSHEIIDALSESIEDANKSSPAYARLSSHMIKILPANTSYRRTDKGTVIRAAFYKDFSPQIDAAYVDDAAGLMVLERPALVDFLRQELLSKIWIKDANMIKDDTDLFSLGVDSLQAIQLRSFILKNLKVDAAAIGRNFVFDFPTIAQMADEILRLQDGRVAESNLTVEERMANMIDRYASFEAHQPVDNADPGHYMVVTGSTGSLGAHTVCELVKQDSVRKIYCLIRAKNTQEASKRLRISLRERCLYHIIPPQERSKLVAVPSDLSMPSLGLDDTQYREVSSNLTHVLHFAWSVNFNKGLESFEKDNVVGVKNLITLALCAKRTRPASFNYCSSVSATVRTPGGVVPEALPESLAYAQNMGYAQSKLVAEHLCNRAAESTGIQARILRVGQIIGDTQHGIWNHTEAIPMIFQTAKTVGALPKLDESPSWLPVDTVAKTCIEISVSDAASGVFNVVNHNTFHWTRDLLPLLRSSGLEFEEVEQREWIRRLRSSNQDPFANPPIKLLDFFAGKYDNDSIKKGLIYQNELAQSYSPSLQQVGIPSASHMSKIVANLIRGWCGDANPKPAGQAIFICGPCGSGKSTVAAGLGKTLTLPIIEGDDMHSIAARAKMQAGNPLTDEDRSVWLAHLRGAVMDRICLSGEKTVFVTCSALKRAYRDELRRLKEIANICTVFVMLATEKREELRQRLNNRSEHYMTASMVDSQMEALEWPKVDENDVLLVDAEQKVGAVLGECSEFVEEVLR